MGSATEALQQRQSLGSRRRAQGKRPLAATDVTCRRPRGGRRLVALVHAGMIDDWRPARQQASSAAWLRRAHPAAAAYGKEVVRRTVRRYAALMLSLRRATRADASLLARLDRYVHQLHVAAEPEIYRPADEELSAERMSAALTRPERLTWIAEMDGEAVGMAMRLR